MHNSNSESFADDNAEPESVTYPDELLDAVARAERELNARTNHNARAVGNAIHKSIANAIGDIQPDSLTIQYFDADGNAISESFSYSDAVIDYNPDGTVLSVGFYGVSDNWR